MAIAVPSTRQALADHYATLGTWISLHTADPGSTGNNEVSGGTPAYARQQTTWTSATGGVINGSQVTIDAPANTYTHIGVWDAQTGGNFIDAEAISETVLGAQGQLLVTPSFTQA